MSPKHPIQSLLVLDDDAVMRDLLQALLTMGSYRITLSPSGEDALQNIANSPAFDAVLTDLRMPGLEGRALVGTLREALPAGTPLLGMSGSEPSPDLKSLFDAFLLKPFDLQLLRNALDDAQTHVAEQTSSFDAASSPADPASIPPLDEKIFGSLLAMISSEQLQQLFAMALKDIEKRHMQMTEALAAHDLATAQREAHAVKGSCGMIGAAELQSLASAIEVGTTFDTKALAEIPLACDRLRRMLNAKLHTA